MKFIKHLRKGWVFQVFQMLHQVCEPVLLSKTFMLYFCEKFTIKVFKLSVFSECLTIVEESFRFNHLWLIFCNFKSNFTRSKFLVKNISVELNLKFNWKFKFTLKYEVKIFYKLYLNSISKWKINARFFSFISVILKFECQLNSK